jgi:hypothetical protein
MSIFSQEGFGNHLNATKNVSKGFQTIWINTVGATQLVRCSQKMRFLESIYLKNQTFVLFAVFLKLTEAFVYASKHFQPSSANGFVSRSVNVKLIFH